MIAPVHPLLPSLSLRQAAAVRWPVLVVGAGPAGAMAAYELARHGAAVLLVDRASFPRPKVCGGCFSAAAVATLDAAGLGDLLPDLAAPSLRWFRWSVPGRQATLPLPGGVAASREAFDAELIRRVVEAGVSFLPETEAQLAPAAADPAVRQVLLRQGTTQVSSEASVVLAADGLAGTLLRRDPRLTAKADRTARLGAGAIVEAAHRDDYEEGTVYMACAQDGYVGLVRLEDGRLGIAAALDRDAIRRTGNLPDAVDRILQETGQTPVDTRQGAWRATPPLTRQGDVAGFRVLLLGDAAGYVEPFTGEGITSALLTGRAVVPLALEAAMRWRPQIGGRWRDMHADLLGRRTQTCRSLTRLLRWPGLTGAAVSLLQRFPALAWPMLRYVNSPAAWPGLATTSWRSPKRKEKWQHDARDSQSRHGAAHLFD